MFTVDIMEKNGKWSQSKGFSTIFSINGKEGWNCTVIWIQTILAGLSHRDALVSVWWYYNRFYEFSVRILQNIYVSVGYINGSYLITKDL